MSMPKTAPTNGISTVTVSHAYDLLCDEGYIRSKEKSGYYVVFREPDLFPVSNDRFEVQLSGTQPQRASCFPFTVLARTMRRVLTEYGEEILQKTPNKGSLLLREAISAEGIAFEKLPLGRSGIESKALQNTNAEVLHITPYRSFPTDITATASKRNEYLRWAEERNGIIIEDDFYSEFSLMKKPEETLFAAAGKNNVIYLNTFTLTVSPALRIGYAVLPEQLMGLYETNVSFYSCPVPTFEQLVLAELIANGDFERHLNREKKRRRRLQDTEKDRI